MNVIKTIQEKDVYPASTELNPANFSTREAARAVVLDAKDQVYLLKVGKYGYHKLPGGGIEAGEDIAKGLERELMEEIGVKAEVQSEIGSIVEYRDQLKVKQTSYCFLTRQIGEQAPSSFDPGELAEDFEVIIAKDIDEAIQIVSKGNPTSYDGPFIVLRDLFLLKQAKEILKWLGINDLLLDCVL